MITRVSLKCEILERYVHKLYIYCSNSGKTHKKVWRIIIENCPFFTFWCSKSYTHHIFSSAFTVSRKTELAYYEYLLLRREHKKVVLCIIFYFSLSLHTTYQTIPPYHREKVSFIHTFLCHCTTQKTEKVEKKRGTSERREWELKNKLLCVCIKWCYCFFLQSK